MSQLSKQCEHCQQLVRPDKYHEHINLHAQPHELVPKTRPNNLKKIGLSKVLHLDDTTDESDLAVRSILPNEVPQPDVGRRQLPPPEHQGQFLKGNGKQGKTGKGIDNNQGRSSNIGFMRGNGSPVNDKLDLQSNVIKVQVQGLQNSKLDIEKEVDIKPKKTVITKKEVHKYQNTHNSARQTIDLGGCEKKVIDNPLAYSRNVMAVPDEPVYVIKEISKPFLFKIQDPKNIATVGFNRKTAQSTPYSAIDTKSVKDPTKVGGRAYKEYDNWSNGSYEKNNQRYSDELSDNSIGNAKNAKDKGGDRQYPLHHHECPDCHGFYCPTCKSTIPPSFRPFWDQSQKPQIIEYYKSIQILAQKEIRHRKQCLHCNQHK